jgi:hypothetical protein
MNNNYHKKQRKHSRSIYLNTDEAFYIDPDRKQFSFRIQPINIEDESKLYVKNTITDYKISGLAVKSVNTGLFLGSTATYSTTYSQAPAITFISQDGKGTGATAIGLLAPSGLSGSASSSTLVVSATAVGAGYTGAVADYPITFTTNTGGSGATLTPSFIDAINGGFSATAVLVAGSGYTEAPTFSVPPPPASVPATFGAVPYTTATGVITGVPSVSNASTNGFYNTNFFAVSFVNNPVRAYGIYQTNATGGITNVIIENSADNGYYGSDAPAVLPFTGGTGFTYTPTYSGVRVVSIIVNTSGTGYGNNLVDYPFQMSLPATPVAGSITGKTITNGRLQSLTFGTGGSKYYKPSVAITGGLVAPLPASYEPVYKIASAIAGARMLTHGYGYTLPPKPIISSTYRVANNGDLPLIAEITQPYNVEKNNYYTIKADGFHFTRTLYTNTDNKGTPTLAICSQNEDVNNENYTELILPAQVINDFTLTITDKDGKGLDPLKNMVILLTIEELDHEETDFKDSKRQQYSTNYSVY